jgi:hypothetical protein
MPYMGFGMEGFMGAFLDIGFLEIFLAIVRSPTLSEVAQE